MPIPDGVDKYDTIFDKFKILSDKFKTEMPLEKYDSKEALETLRLFNNNFNFDEKENFYGLKEKIGNFEFRLNLSLRFGIVEIILSAKDHLTNNQYGGPLSRIIRQIQLEKVENEVVKIKYPRFSSYDELREIVNEVFEIYLDFKKLITENEKTEP